MSKFVLMENWETRYAQEMPGLGEGLIMAVLKQNHMQAYFMPGQTKFLKHLFIDDTEEIILLARDLDKQTLKELDLGVKIQSIETDEFQAELKNLYNSCVRNKNPRIYVNLILYQELTSWMHRLLKIQHHYLVKERYHDIPLLRHYKCAIQEISPFMVGFSIASSENAFIKALRTFVRQEGIPCVVGGTFSANFPQTMYPKIMDKESDTYYVVGPGEEALPQLLAALDGQGDLESVPNLVYWKNERLKINHQAFITNLDSLPDPDFTQFELNKYITPVPVLPFETSRGCYWRKCVFCNEFRLPDFYTYSVEQIIKRFQDYIEKYNVHHYHLTDEHIAPDLALAVSEAVVEEGIDLNLYALARLDLNMNDAETLGKLYKGGFKALHWGFESGNQRVLNSMGKGTRLSIIPKILLKAHQVGIQNFLFVMFGFPGETEAELTETVNFLKKYDHLINLYTLQYFLLSRGILMFQNLDRWRIHLMTDDLNDKQPTRNFEFTVDIGMSREAMKKTVRRLRAKKSTNSILNNPNRVNLNQMSTDMGVTYYFLLASHNILPQSEALTVLSSSKVIRYHPMMSGHVKECHDQTLFQPISLNETMWIYKTIPPKPIPVSSLEKQVWILSDGRSSIQEILDQICFPELSQSEIRHCVMEFLQKGIKEYWCVLFEKPWQTPPAADL